MVSCHRVWRPFLLWLCPRGLTKISNNYFPALVNGQCRKKLFEIFHVWVRQRYLRPDSHLRRRKKRRKGANTSARDQKIPKRQAEWVKIIGRKGRVLAEADDDDEEEEEGKKTTKISMEANAHGKNTDPTYRAQGQTTSSEVRENFLANSFCLHSFAPRRWPSRWQTPGINFFDSLSLSSSSFS